MPLASAYPTAAGVPDSGVAITRSASAGASAASLRPISTRERCTLRPAMSVSGRARYTYSKTQPLGFAAAKRVERSPFSSMATSSPGSISRMKEAPQMSRAAVSEATTQPRSSRPRTSGRMPCGSRAAYSVCSSMKTREKAPSTSGRTLAAASSMVSGLPSESTWPASSAVTRSVSLVAATWVARPPSRGRSATISASWAVLTRLPLWPSAMEPWAVARKVGCAFSHTEAPVVE